MAPPADRRRGAPLPIVGSFFSPLYAWEVARRNRAFDRGAGVTTLDIPVISVGNLSVGGTGKTPMVRWLHRHLTEMDKHPVIAMRGYKAKAGQRSDEEAEYHATLDACIVAAQPSRVAGIARARGRHPEINCVLLDDGFQHRKLARDLDIVLIDATRSPFDDACLPGGWLREPVDSLARAHAAVLTRTDVASTDALRSMTDRLSTSFPRLTVARSRHAWSGYRVGDGRVSLGTMRGEPVHIATGIGHPSALVEQAEREGLRVVGTTIKPDHHAWTRAEAERLLASGERVLVTEKDWVKLAPITNEAERFVRPILDLAVDDAGPLLDRVRGLAGAS